jgi:transposase-like protein
MYLNNVGIRKIARFSGASSTAVIKWIRAARQNLSNRCHQAAEQIAAEWPDVIEMDEIYTFVKKNSNGRSYGRLIAGEKVVLLPTVSEKASMPR